MKIFRTIYPGLLWLSLIWLLSSLPSNNLPSYKIIGIDKLAHISIYAILFILFSPWLRQKSADKSTVLLFWLFMLFLAALDEYHQSFIPGRSVSIYDFLANSTGLSLGYILHRYGK